MRSNFSILFPFFFFLLKKKKKQDISLPLSLSRKPLRQPPDDGNRLLGDPGALERPQLPLRRPADHLGLARERAPDGGRLLRRRRFLALGLGEGVRRGLRPQLQAVAALALDERNRSLPLLGGGELGGDAESAELGLGLDPFFFWKKKCEMREKKRNARRKKNSTLTWPPRQRQLCPRRPSRAPLPSSACPSGA